MPRLPDYTAVGVIQPRPASFAPHYSAAGLVDTEGPKQLVKFGQEIYSIGAQKQQEKEAVDVATATADITIARDRIKEQESQNPDYQGAPQRYQQQVDEQTNAIAQRLSGQTRELWIQQQRLHNESGQSQINGYARKRWSEDYILSDDNKIEEIGKSALKEVSPFARYDKLKTIDGTIDSEVRLGILSRPQAEARKRAFTEKYSYAFELDEMRRDPQGYKQKLDSMYPDGFQDVPAPEGSTLAKQRKTMTDIGEMVSPLMRERSSGRYYDPNTGTMYDKGGEPIKDTPTKERQSLMSPESNSGGTPMQIASQFLGKNEQSNRQELAAFFDKAGGPHLDPAKTAWCARFVNSVLATAGVKGTGSDMARSFLNIGTPVKPQQAEAGDVIVFPRGRSGTLGHVGFVKDVDLQNNTVTILSGNTGGAVRTETRSLSGALGIRRIEEQHVGLDIPIVSDQQATA
jgi:uncharacterized protein (TIGR02594 family)